MKFISKTNLLILWGNTSYLKNYSDGKTMDCGQIDGTSHLFLFFSSSLSAAASSFKMSSPRSWDS